MSESPLDGVPDGVKAAAGVALLLWLLYGLLLAANALAAVLPVLSALFLWLLYRFVVAHERVAGAQERRARAAERRTGAGDD